MYDDVHPVEPDLDSTLTELAALALPYHDVWCILDVVEDERMWRVPVVHPVASQQELARELQSGWPPARDAPGTDIRVMRTREPEIASVSDASLPGLAGSPHELDVLRELRIGSVLTVPVVAEREVLGAMTFLAPRWGHAFDNQDRLLAQDVAAGAARAILAARRVSRVPEPSGHGTENAHRASYMHSLSQTFDAGARIEANERRILRMVNAIISFAQFDQSGAVVLQDIAVLDALQRTNVSVLGAARLKGVLYQFGFVADAAIVRAEPMRLHEILLQLLLNAIQFAGAGDAVAVSTAVVGERVWIRVTDAGSEPGASERERIFRPFGKTRDAHASAQTGFGLGLAILQKLARTMQGELTVRGTPGSGATFTLALPRGRLP